LTSGEFIQRILVPEVGVRLIMEDKNLTGNGGAEKALAILRESANYGVAMFPEDGGEWGDGTRDSDDDGDEGGEMGAADMIVMERARKRRQELEVEEKLEGDAGKSGRGTGKGRKTKPRAKEKEKEKPKREQKKDHDDNVPDSSDTHRTDPIPRPRPRPRPLPKPTFEPGETDDSKSDGVDKPVTSDSADTDLDLGDGFPNFQPTLTHANLVTPRAAPPTNKRELQPNGHTRDREGDRTKPSFCVYIQQRVGSQSTPQKSAKAKGKKKAESASDEEVEVVETCSISPRVSGRRKEVERTPRPIQMTTDRDRSTSDVNGHDRSSKSLIGEDRSRCPLMIAKQRKKPAL
jgi:hypothetical protein